MKLESKTGEELASVNLSTSDDKSLSAEVQLGDLRFKSPEVQSKIEKRDGNLVTSMRIPGMVNFNLVLEPSDVKALKGIMSKDALTFMMGAFFKKK